MSSFILSTSSSFSRAELIAKMKMAIPHMANVAYIIYLVALGSNSILINNERWQKRERERERGGTKNNNNNKKDGKEKTKLKYRT